MAGFMFMILGKLGGGWIKYLLIALAIGLAFAYIRNMGVQSERARWEEAIRIENIRQTRINDKLVLQSIVDADAIDFETEQMRALVERAQNEALNDSTGTCLDAGSVQRLNTVR